MSNFYFITCFFVNHLSAAVSVSVVFEYQVAAGEAEEKTAEMTKAVDELKKLLKQATQGETCSHRPCQPSLMRATQMFSSRNLDQLKNTTLPTNFTHPTCICRPR